MRSSTLILLFGLAFIGNAALAAEPGPNVISVSQSANEFFQRGFSDANNGDYEAAIKNYSLAISRDPNRIYFYYHRGLAFRAKGDKARAIVDFQHCIEMKPIAEAYYELGVFKYEELDLWSAKKYFEQARDLKEDVEKVNFYLGVINYRFNNYDTAELLLSHYIQLVKTNSDAFLYLAMVKVRMHKYEEVEPMLRLVSLYNDNDWQLHLKMYDIYKEMDDRDNMLYHISMVIEMGQGKPEYYKIRAQLYEERGDNLQAEYDYLAAKGGK